MGISLTRAHPPRAQEGGHSTWQVIFPTDQSTHFLGSKLNWGGSHKDSDSVPATCVYFLHCPPQLCTLHEPITRRHIHF
jgi:hypothetical protein